MDQLKIKAVGKRQDVWDGVAKKTSGGLTKEDLFMCPRTGSIKSKKASQQSKTTMSARNNPKNEPVASMVKKIEDKLGQEAIAVSPPALLIVITKTPVSRSKEPILDASNEVVAQKIEDLLENVELEKPKPKRAPRKPRVAKK